MRDIHFKALSKNYGRVRALAEINLHVPAGQIVAILGPSGSGKSTLLHICAGLIMPTSGGIELGGIDITNLSAEHRDIGMVFQSYALFPHLSVLENVAFPLRTRRHRTTLWEARKRADEMLARVGLHGYGSRRPDELSGGQQQRVALARALVFRPELLLLDEPLGAVDPQIKLQLLEDIRRLRDELGVTMLYVTHDQQEAMSIADRVAVLRHGVLQQVGTAQAIYDNPTNEFVATFVGASNLVPGRVEAAGCGFVTVSTGAGNFQASGSSADVRLGDDVLLLIRPEAISAMGSVKQPQGLNHASGSVTAVRFFGAFVRTTVDIWPGGTCWIIDHLRTSGDGLLSPGATVNLSWRVSDTHVVGEPRRRLLAAPGCEVDPTSDVPSQAHTSTRRQYA